VKALSVSSFLFWREGSVRGLQETAPDCEPDGLDAFAAEGDAGISPASASMSGGRGRQWIVGALAIVALIEAPAAGLWLYERLRQAPATAAPMPRRPDLQAAPLVVSTPVPESAEPAASLQALVAMPAAPRAASAESDRATPAAGVGGWVSIKTPAPMQVFEDGRLISTTEAERIMLPVGTHRLEIVSDALGYRSRQDVAIRAGQTSTLRLELPTGTLALNALPWAEVWIDGERVGETPMGNLSRTIGTHEVLFRHPDLGERRTTVTVTLKDAARVGVDLRSK
jgi:hypothetical protein